jgi:hypothetical protein
MGGPEKWRRQHIFARQDSSSHLAFSWEEQRSGKGNGLRNCETVGQKKRRRKSSFRRQEFNVQ